MGRRQRRGLFRFENSWAKEEECRFIIKKVWVEKSRVSQVQRSMSEQVLKRLEEARKQVSNWGYNKFRKRGEEIKMKEKRLQELQTRPVKDNEIR